MTKLYPVIVSYLISVCFLTGCKLDKPVYPSNISSSKDTTVTSVPVTGTTGKGTTGTGTTGNPLTLVDNGSTITYTIDGNTTVFNMVAIQVIKPDAGLHPTGSTQIIGGLDNSGGFSLSFSSIKPGYYNIDLLFLGNSTGSGGKLVATTLTTTDGFHGTIIGTFTTDLTDVTTGAVIKGVSGTFNIQI